MEESRYAYFADSASQSGSSPMYRSSFCSIIATGFAGNVTTSRPNGSASRRGPTFSVVNRIGSSVS